MNDTSHRNLQKRTNFFHVDRRLFLAGVLSGSIVSNLNTSFAMKKTNEKCSLCLFSKHLGWMNYEQLAETTAQLGFTGVDLTVRPKGHVLPENVERDLPKATKAIRGAGLDVMMITTRIADPDDKTTHAILKTASELGIPFYRIGSWKYDPKREILPQLREWNTKLKKLEKFNRMYNVRAGYHNHSGHNYIGAPMWDIYEMLKGIDPEWIGCNFDAAHAVAEGGYGAWEINFKLLADRIKMCAIKDSQWVKQEGRWRMTHPPVGEGMTPWPQVLSMLKEAGFSGPMSMHFEYDIPAKSEEEERKKSIECIRRDANVFRKMLEEADMISI